MGSFGDRKARKRRRQICRRSEQRRGHAMKGLGLAALAALLMSGAASAEERLVVNGWGGPFQTMIMSTVAKKFTEETGVKVDFVAGGTIDRLNRAKLVKAKPESDVTFTTSHVGWLYIKDGLFEPIDFSKLPNSSKLVPKAKASDYHVGLYGYVYSIAYRTDLAPKDVAFTSWNDLWNPKLKGMIGLPDFDASHIVKIATMLQGGQPEDWKAAQPKLAALKPNLKAFYSNSATSIQLLSSGETPVQVLLSSNAYNMISQGVPVKLVIPKEGALLGLDTMAITKGTDKLELAHKFLNIALDPQIQGQIADMQKASPVVLAAKVSAEVASLPGIFTTQEQWDTGALAGDDKLRAEMLGGWNKWFAENLMN
jgi:putative spermidine/putrescine transport system substrate-binding protein